MKIRGKIKGKNSKKFSKKKKKKKRKKNDACMHVKSEYLSVVLKKKI